MKTRNGLVSNSSSSSFIIAVKKMKKGDLTSPSEMIDFLIKHSGLIGGRDALKFFTKTPKQYNDALSKETKELEANIKWAESQKAYCEEALKDKKIMEVLGRMKHIGQAFRNRMEKGGTEEGRILREYTPTVQKELKNDIETLGYRIEGDQKQIEELNAKAKKIKRYLNGEWKLIGFEEDHWGDILKSAVKEMVKKKQAFIVEEVNT